MRVFAASEGLGKSIEAGLIVAGLVLMIVFSLQPVGFESLDKYHEIWLIDELLTVLMFGGLAALLLLFRWAQNLSSEIKRRVAAEEKATKLARHDPLTGLPNRRVLNEELATALLRVRSKAAECAVLLVDLDRFKPINDVHGHAVGDDVLIEVGNRMASAVGDKGTVARMGGDEFACIIPYDAGSDEPTRLARQIISSINQPFIVEGVKLDISCTVGVSRSPQDGMTPGELLRGADLAMYDGKRDGRSTYRFFNAEMDMTLRERSALESDLRQATGAGQIIPYFQPVFDLRDERIIGFEALARWEHPSKGLIAPDIFIPIAEDLGIIAEITDSMLRASCLAARDWPASLWVSVNVSPRQLKDEWLASRLLAVLSETGIAPGRLIVEVTENSIIEDMISAQEIFTSLQNAGVRIALDDFGKGYSSLYHLRQLQFDHLKIDGSFVHSMDSDESAKIVSAMAGLGKSLGMPITAEGVETKAEADALRLLGCEHAQGFLFGKPLNAADTIKLLKTDKGNASIAA